MRTPGPYPPTEAWCASRPDVHRPWRIDPAGRHGPTKGQAYGPHYRRVAPGLFRPAAVAESIDQRIADASSSLPDHGGVTGWAALRWQGGRWFEGTDGDGVRRPVVLDVIGSCRVARPGLVHTKERVRPDELTVHDGVRLTLPTRSTLYEMRWAPSLEAAVVALDMACFSDLVSLAEMGRIVAEHRSWTGIGQARRALALGVENAWSPREVRMRLWWRELEPAYLWCNRPVFDGDGRHVATPDLLDPVAGVAGEYDGGLHLSGARRARDLRREERMRAIGLEPVTMVAADSREEVLDRLRTAYLRAERRPADLRRWVLEPPAWWRPTLTVAQRRALTAADRTRLLAHRAA